MSGFDQIAFFWIGNDNNIPTFLVKSLKLIYNNKVKIFHLTNFTTKRINGTTRTIRYDLHKDIMLARLQAYKDFPYNKNLTFFCDADSLFIQKLDLFKLNQSIYLIKRSENFVMNHMYPEYYPEFEKKTALEVMPFLFGGMAFRDGKKFFTKLFETCLQLPDRFHRWYGDQYSLMLNIKKDEHGVNYLNQDIYLKIVRSKLKREDYKVLINQNVKIITFKGLQTKNFIKDSFNSLAENY